MGCGSEPKRRWGLAHDVFISYSHYDVGYAEALCRGLERRGLKCWMAPRDIPAGENFAESIIDGLTNARAFVLVLSPYSNKSEHVAKEVNKATTLGRSIFYLRTEEVALSKTLDYYLGNLQWMDAFGFPDDATLDKLAGAIRTAILHRPPRHPTTIPGAPAPVPSTNDVGRQLGLEVTPTDSPPPIGTTFDDSFVMPEPAPRRLPWLWIGLAVLLLILLGVGAALLIGGKDGRSGAGPQPTATVDRLASAHVTLINSLDVGLTLHLVGQDREYTYTVEAGKQLEIYVLAGTYQYQMNAEGFTSLSGEKSWDSGDWEWEFYTEPYTPTP